ncbi:MAG TPA: hypothetical protein VJ596_06625 [Gemmatimonadaceae bacterium]|nr:hypothetical protein [Gemmatimonadaceae bacterium]
MADPGEFPSEEITNAWLANPRCVECGELVASVAESALLVGPGRVAHREWCFVPALIRLNPLLNQLAAQKRAKEVQPRCRSLHLDQDGNRGVRAHG